MQLTPLIILPQLRLCPLLLTFIFLLSNKFTTLCSQFVHNLAKLSIYIVFFYLSQIPHFMFNHFYICILLLWCNYNLRQNLTLLFYSQLRKILAFLLFNLFRCLQLHLLIGGSSFSVKRFLLLRNRRQPLFLHRLI